MSSFDSIFALDCSAVEKMLLLVLRLNSRDGQASLRVNDIARLASISERSVQQASRTLARRGILTVTPGQRGNRQHANIYQLAI